MVLYDFRNIDGNISIDNKMKQRWIIGKNLLDDYMTVIAKGTFSRSLHYIFIITNLVIHDEKMMCR